MVGLLHLYGLVQTKDPLVAQAQLQPIVVAVCMKPFSFSWLAVKNNYSWYVNVSDGITTIKSDVWHFIIDDEPRAVNMRIDDIQPKSVSVKWDNEPDMEWISLRIGSDILEVRDITGSASSEWNVSVLYSDYDYTFEWQLGDALLQTGNYHNLTFRSQGWTPSLINYPYKRLVTINSSQIGSDLDNYAVNVSLTEDNFNYFDTNDYTTYPSFF